MEIEEEAKKRNSPDARKMRPGSVNAARQEKNMENNNIAPVKTDA